MFWYHNTLTTHGFENSLAQLWSGPKGDNLRGTPCKMSRMLTITYTKCRLFTDLKFIKYQIQIYFLY
jgi:hypothetical protein